jgi:hypothetical protein
LCDAAQSVSPALSYVGLRHVFNAASRDCRYLHCNPAMQGDNDVIHTLAAAAIGAIAVLAALAAAAGAYTEAHHAPNQP